MKINYKITTAVFGYLAVSAMAALVLKEKEVEAMYGKALRRARLANLYAKECNDHHIQIDPFTRIIMNEIMAEIKAE